MRVATTEFTGRRGATIVQDLFLETFAWIPREIHDTDLGVDFDVEVVTEGQTRGRHLGIQVKSGPSWFDERSSAGWWFRFGDDHYQYWLNHDFPIIVVLVDLERRCAYWQQVTADTAVPAGENWKLEVPAAQVLDASARETLAGLADAPRVYGDAALTAFHDHLGHLPPEAVTALVRLHAQVPRTNLEARRPVERLTATLAGGRHDPDACCAVLLERTPNWLTGRTKTNPKWQGPDEREVWCAIGGYANEHELPARAADAFARAAAAGAQPPGHWQASAGIFEMNAGVPQAEQTLRAARDLEGGQILADIGLAILAHRGRPGPAEVPQSLSAHNIDAWRTSPTARMFLGDQCAARNDYDGALTHYEAALSRSPGSSAAQILIARALLARLSTHLSPGRDQDLRRVLQLASDARAARRCWDGPSETAAEVLMQARLLQADVDAALAVALPAPDGEATPREAAAASLTALAARGAYLAGQLDTGDALAAASAAASPLYTAQLAAFRAQASGAQAQELRRLWTTALDDAPSEDQRFIAIQYLAQAGQWPIPALEERRAAATIPPDVYAVLAAKAHTQLGDLPQAARTLRPLQHTSVLAVMELADILEQAGTPHEAATVLRQAADRFADLNLELKALDVLRRCGDDQALVQRALLLLARPGLPSTIRQRLRQHLLDHAYRMRDWAMAGEHAEMGLNDLLTANPDTDAADLVRSNEAAQDFAWAKTGALYNLRRWNEAWAVWERYQPQPASTQQALIWLHLIRRRPWTERGVRALLDVRTRFAADDEVSSQVLDAVNRALTVADDPAQPQWGAPWTQTPTPDLLHELRTLAGQAMDDHQARHPNGSLTTVVGAPDADTLKALHTTAAARSSTHRQVLQAIRDGDAVLGLAASTLNGLYTQSLIQRAAGLLPAATTNPAAQEAEHLAATQALDTTIVLDPSALALTALLPGRWDALRAHLAAVHLPDVCMDDILRTEDAIDRLLAATYTASLADDATTVQTTTLTTAAKTHLATQISAITTAADATTLIPVTGLDAAEAALNPRGTADTPTLRLEIDGPWAAPLQAALTHHLPLWSDDALLREIARDAGIPAFGTLALTRALIDQDRLPDTRDDDHALLLRQYVVDLPLDEATILDQAEADEWRPGAVTAALSRPAPWGRPDALTTWATLVQTVAGRDPDQLGPWTHLASLGAGAAEPDPYRTTAQVLVTALAATGPTPERATTLVAASVEAAILRGLSPYAWTTAVHTALAEPAAPGQPQGPNATEIEQIIAQFIRRA